LTYDAPGGSWCYDDDPANCAIYGRLYTYTEATGVCPAGSHLGTDEDWMLLEAKLGMSGVDLLLEGYSTVRGTDEADQLKVGGGSGFDALMTGYWGGSFTALSDRTYFWTGSTDGAGWAYRRKVAVSDSTIFRFTNPNDGFANPVRCVVD
jgi:uncharacterized protein (TIGR02145 family)